MDPRTDEGRVSARPSVLTPLMEAIRKTKGEVVNFCPFGCEDHELDELGYCGHLHGFHNQGTRVFEPRAVRKKDGRIIVDGAKPRVLEKGKGYKLVWGTTSARVYSPQLRADLVVKNTDHMDKAARDIHEQERVLHEAIERVRNPVRVDGDWDDAVYDTTPLLAPPEAPKA